MPDKSGITGRIAGLYSKNFVVDTWSPRRNEKGNSELVMNALKLLTTKTVMSIL
ncbi:glutaminase [Flavobacterium urumqiense]|uniref:glutaminase n=1 Tax=Flavobacterium urumqiense TaxID=935224 RepID=UPI001FC97DCA|nr:glutaminase [Flavobacterium urumqiense]